MPTPSPERQRPPTVATTLPIIAATFLANVAIDVSTDWPMLLRWAASLVVGLAVGAVALTLWRCSQHGPGETPRADDRSAR